MSVIKDEFPGAEAEMARRLLALQRSPSVNLLDRVRSIPDQPAPRLAWGLAVALLLLSLLVVASPSLRATVGVVQDAIGDIYLAVTDRLFEHGEVVTVPRDWMSLEAARAAVPFSFSLPAVAPDGWRLAAEVGVGHLDGIPSVEVHWRKPGQGVIYLYVQPIDRPDDGSPLQNLVGVDSFREIEIDGRPAVVVQGGWDSGSRQWAHPEVTTVLWAGDGVQYSLSSADPEVQPEDLIEMAASTGQAHHPMPTRLPFQAGEMTPVATERVPLEAAQAKVGFEFGLPQDAPAGWVLDDNVALVELWGGRPDVGIRWLKPDHEPIGLNIHSFAGDTPPVLMVAPGTVREVEVNGWPVTIVAGDWDWETGEWRPDAGFTVQWIADQVQYTLSSADPSVSLDDLLAMVASTR